MTKGGGGGGRKEEEEEEEKKRERNMSMSKENKLTEYLASHPPSARKEGSFLGENTKLSETPTILDIILDLYKQYIVISSTKVVFA